MIERLQGFEAAAGAWERELLPSRVAGYQPGWLDELCLSGEVAWGRLGLHESARHAGRRLSAAVPVALLLRRDLAWLLAARAGDAATDRTPAAASPIQPSGPARDVLAHLERAGASFVDDIASGVRRLRIEVEEALCELVTAGLVTGDGFAGLRSLLHGEKRRRARPGRPVAPPGPRPAPVAGPGCCRPPRRPPTTWSRPGPPVREALRRGLPRSAAARAGRPGLARSAARLPPARDARRPPRRAHRGRLRGRAVRGARGARGAARHPPRSNPPARSSASRPATR